MKIFLTHYSSHILRAAQQLIDLDDRQANAVAARIELDLRIGAAFTRLQTLQLQNLTTVLNEKTISYGMVLQSTQVHYPDKHNRLLPVSHSGVRG
jgi:DNA topoisomerase-3